jgi:hypothetical protein
VSLPDHELRTLMERLVRSPGWAVVEQQMLEDLLQARRNLESEEDCSATERARRVGIVNGMIRAMSTPGRILDALPDDGGGF